MESLLIAGAGGRSIPVVAAFRDSTAVLVLVHGFASQKVNSTTKALFSHQGLHGVSIVSIDLFAHGDSTEPFSEFTVSKAIADVRCVIDELQRRGFSRIGLLGSSLGGLAALLAADERVSYVILKSPVVYDQGRLVSKVMHSSEQDWQKNGTLVHPDFPHRTLPFSFFTDAQKHDSRRSLWRGPILIVHGDADTVVPLSQSRELAAERQAQLCVIPGAGHTYTAEEISFFCTQVAAFVKNNS